MKIKEELLKEHSRRQAVEIANCAGSSAKNLQELMDCFFTSEYRVAQRAAWSVSYVAQMHPELIKPYMGQLTEQLNKKDIHAAVIRNSVRVLQYQEIPEEYHAPVINACFKFIENAATPAAIKAFSITTLANLSRHYPEIKNELKLVIEAKWDTESPAFKARAKLALNGK